MRFRHFASLDAPLPATYRELHHKEAAVTIPRLGPGQDAAMPPKDPHGKTAQDYRAALIAELDAVPDYRRRRKAQRSPLLFVWLLVPLSLLWLSRPNAKIGLAIAAGNSSKHIRKFEFALPKSALIPDLLYASRAKTLKKPAAQI